MNTQAAWQIAVAIAALMVSILSFVLAWLSNRRTRKAEEIKNLLGEKETVAYAGLKLMRDGLPNNMHDCRLLLGALLQACLFEGSDRARAILYRVIELHRDAYRYLLEHELKAIETTFENMEKYEFGLDELDLTRGQRRLKALKKVIKGV
jgi:hypothetical protein